LTASVLMQPPLASPSHSRAFPVRAPATCRRT
jgi:hypothetical protein